MSKQVNLLEGSIFGKLTRLAMPIMMTAFVQMAYNLVDMIWIGILGSGAVAAVGAAGIYLWIADSCTSVAKMGGQIKVAHSIGQGNTEKARSFAAGAFQLGVFIILICVAIVVFAHQLMVGVFQFTDAKIHGDAVAYLLITGTAGIFFSTINQVFTGIYTGIGDSKTPFLATALGLVLNLIFDPILIFGIGPIPAMGVTARLSPPRARRVSSLCPFWSSPKSNAAFLSRFRFSKSPISAISRKSGSWASRSAFKTCLCPGYPWWFPGSLPPGAREPWRCKKSAARWKASPGWSPAAFPWRSTLLSGKISAPVK